MAPNISQDLSRISKSAAELNQVVDEATLQIRQLDEFLLNANFGIEYESPQPFHNAEDENRRGHKVDTSYWLGYGRADGGFALVVRAIAEKTDADGNAVPIPDGYHDFEYETVWTRRLEKVNRTLRLKALEQLPSFLSALAGHLEATTKAARECLDNVRSVADELRAALGAAASASTRQRERGQSTTGSSAYLNLAPNDK